MNANSSPVTDEAEIRASMDRWLDAARAGDLDGIMSYYAPDIVAYDAIAQLQFKGVDAYKQHWAACMAMCPGAMIFETHQLTIAAAGDVAFAHGLMRCGGTNESGEEKVSWMRMSSAYRKRNGNWLTVHEHFSAPFDMESGKALFALQP